MPKVAYFVEVESESESAIKKTETTKRNDIEIFDEDSMERNKKSGIYGNLSEIPDEIASKFTPTYCGICETGGSGIPLDAPQEIRQASEDISKMKMNKHYESERHHHYVKLAIEKFKSKNIPVVNKNEAAKEEILIGFNMIGPLPITNDGFSAVLVAFESSKNWSAAHPMKSMLIGMDSN